MSYDLGSAHGKIELEYTGHGDVDRAQKDMDDTDRKAKEAEKGLSRLQKRLSSLGKAATALGKFGGIGVGLLAAGAAAGNLTAQILGIVPALTSVLSLSAALPGAFVGMLATISVLKAAFAGVGDTIKAAFDPKGAAKFQAGLKELSPAAQDFAKAIKANVSSFRAYQKSLQESFFRSADLAGVIPRVNSVLTQLQPSLRGIASQFGLVSRQVVDFGTSAASVNFISNALVTLRSNLATIAPSLTPLLTGLRSVGEVGLPLLERMGVTVSGLATRFGNWLSAVSSDGRLNSWIDTALSTLSTLGTIAKNVGGILQSVFSTAASTSGGLLNAIASITGAFNVFLQSAAGKQALTALFTGLAAAAGALTPVITTLVGALAGALGPALATLANSLGPALLTVVQALAPAFGPVATALASLVTAVAPLLGPIAQLVSLLAQQLATAIQGLSSELGPLISLFAGALLQAFQAFLPVVQAFAQQLPTMAALGAQLAAAFAPLAPVIVQIAQAFAGALLQSMPAILSAFQQLAPVIVQFATTLAGPLTQGLLAIVPLIPPLVSGFAALTPILVTILSAGIQFASFLVNLAAATVQVSAAIVRFGSTLVTNVVGALRSAYNGVVGAGQAIIGWFQALPGRVMGFLTPLPGRLASLAANALRRMAFAVGAGIGIVLSFFLNAPTRIGAALQALPGILRGIATRAWNALRAIFTSGTSNAVATARALPGRAAAAISSLIGQLGAKARAAWNALKSAFSSGVNGAVGIARSLPGRIRSAVGNLGGLLVSAGRDAVIGLANGIKGAVGAAVNAASSVGRQVIAGIRSTLKIGSPSRVMIAIGRFVTQGLRQGLLGTVKQVQAAATRLANAVRDAFSDKLIRRSQRNSVLAILSRGTRQLVALVNRSNAVAKRLKSAQANLTAVQKQYADAQTSAAQKVRDSFNIVTTGQGFVNLALTKERFTDAVKQAQQFAKDIQTLAKRGLNKDLLAQLADAGAADGAVMARALATASGADIKQFNALQVKLNSAAGSVGKVTADALYGAGVRAAQGIVKGLQSQQKAIDRQMLAIATSMINAIKRVLKIRSPSRAMFTLGAFISRGLINGILSLHRQVARAASTLANSAILPTVRLTTTQALAGFRPGVVTGGAGLTNVNNFSQTVNALPGMNAKQVGDYSLTKLRLSLATGVGAVNLATPTPAGA